MPVETTTRRKSYTGNAVTTVFAYDFRILTSADLKVYLDGVLQSSGYTVSGVGAALGGNVTFTSAPGTGVAVLLIRVVARTQLVDLVNNETILEGTLDVALDKLTMIAQELADDVASLAAGTTGNMPVATGSDVGKFLKATGIGVTAYNALAKADIPTFDEDVDDRVNTLTDVVGGLTKTYNDGAGTLTFSAQTITDRLDFTTPTYPRRQTVASGPQASTGLPNWIPASGGSLTLTAQNITGSAILAVVAANGADTRVARLTTNPAWTLSSSATNFLAIRVNADGTVTTRVTTLAPTYVWSGAPSTTNGQYTFRIDEMRMYLGDGAAANQVWDVVVGEAVASGSSFSGALAYAHSGRAQSAAQTVGAAASLQTHTHNLGLAPQRAELFALCGTNDLNYTAGDIVANPTTEGGGGGYAPFTILTRRNDLTVRLGSTTALRLINNTSGQLNAATSASWSLFSRVSRGDW